MTTTATATAGQRGRGDEELLPRRLQCSWWRRALRTWPRSWTRIYPGNHLLWAGQADKEQSVGLLCGTNLRGRMTAGRGAVTNSWRWNPMERLQRISGTGSSFSLTRRRECTQVSQGHNLSTKLGAWWQKRRYGRDYWFSGFLFGINATSPSSSPSLSPQTSVRAQPIIP
jgi:hypothetical protein